MSNEIIPMLKSEIKQLDSAISEIKNKYRTGIEDEMMNAGFAIAKVLNYDNDFILVDLSYGVDTAIPEFCFQKNIKISRHNMEVIETEESIQS